MENILSSICEFVNGKICLDELNESTYISTENMLPNRGGITKASSLPSTTYSRLFLKEDVLVSNIRPYFKKIWIAKFDGGCSNDVLVFRAKSHIDSKFLYYLLSDDSFFEYATLTAKGTKMPRGDKIAIMNYEIPIFPLKEQQKISKILSSLDEKIEINRKINENLEEQAKEIFLENFVRNEKNYTNWEKVSLIDIANYLNGLAIQKYRPKENEESLPVLKIKELRQGVTDKSSELCSCNIDSNYIINNGDIIFSWSGSLLVDIWCGGTCGLNQHLFKVTSDKYEKWFYYLWTKYHLDEFILIAKDKATTMGHIKRENLKNAQVLIPSDEEYKKLTLILKPMIDLIIDIKIQIQKLSSIRDELLPKLMTGEIDVSKIDI